MCFDLIQEVRSRMHMTQAQQSTDLRPTLCKDCLNTRLHKQFAIEDCPEHSEVFAISLPRMYYLEVFLDWVEFDLIALPPNMGTILNFSEFP